MSKPAHADVQTVFFSKRQVAKLLGLSLEAVNQLSAAETIPAVKLSHRRTVVPVEGRELALPCGPGPPWPDGHDTQGLKLPPNDEPAFSTPDVAGKSGARRATNDSGPAPDMPRATPRRGRFATHASGSRSSASRAMPCNS